MQMKLSRHSMQTLFPDVGTRVIQGTHAYSTSNWASKTLTTVCFCRLIVLFELVMIRSSSTNWGIVKPTLLLKCWLKYFYMASQAPKKVMNGYTLKKMKGLRIHIFCNHEASRREKLSKFSLKLFSKCILHKKERMKNCWVSREKDWKILNCFILSLWATFKEEKPQFQKIKN